MISVIRFLRRNMYRNARVLGDIQAVLQWRIVHRVAQRKTGKLSRRVINHITRGLMK